MSTGPHCCSRITVQGGGFGQALSSAASAPTSGFGGRLDPWCTTGVASVFGHPPLVQLGVGRGCGQGPGSRGGPTEEAAGMQPGEAWVAAMG